MAFKMGRAVLVTELQVVQERAICMFHPQVASPIECGLKTFLRLVFRLLIRLSTAKAKSSGPKSSTSGHIKQLQKDGAINEKALIAALKTPTQLRATHWIPSAYPWI